MDQCSSEVRKGRTLIKMGQMCIKKERVKDQEREREREDVEVCEDQRRSAMDEAASDQTLRNELRPEWKSYLHFAFVMQVTVRCDGQSADGGVMIPVEGGRAGDGAGPGGGREGRRE